VDGLAEDSRSVVVLKIYADLTFEQIGQVMQQPTKTVATKYRRALLKLDEKLRGLL
jgi:DNA-directed RNA polymerase specialized sigma24 family protein